MLDHTIVSANTGGDVVSSITTNSFTSQGRNLIGNGNATGDFTQIGDQTGVTNPKLSPLGYFGGPTMTMHPLIGSPAIDAGGTTNPGGTDQRGFPRFVDGDGSGMAQLDIGAVETWPRARSLITPDHPVTTAADEDNGSILPGFGTGTSLREAVKYAPNFAPNNFVVTFAPGLAGQTITLGGSELLLDKNFFLDASNLSGGVTISGNNASRVFDIASGATVAMHGLVITGGRAADGANGPGGGGQRGGGIYNDGSLSLFSCAITNCRSGNGGTSVQIGGIGGDGGGIFNLQRLSLHACSVTGNVTGSGGNGGIGSGVGGSGGGIGHAGFNATLTLTDCTITGNRTGDGGTGSRGGDGGGISSGSSLRLVASTVSGNRTGSGSSGTGDGGGLDLFGAATLQASTISGNQAREGGGINLLAKGLLLDHCTVAGNSSTGRGGGIGNSPFGFAFTLRHTIIAGNIAADMPDISSAPTVMCPVVSFIGDTAAVSITGTAPLTGNALLAPLGDYGGPTQTMLPLPGSQVINNATGSTATTDQRGLPRDADPDLGAVEAQPALSGFIDTDSDGMDDRLEPLYGFIVGVQDGQLDADGDGSTNAAELANKTGPRDPSSLLKMLSISKTGDNVTFTWTSFPGLGYTAQFGNTLSFGGNVFVGTATGMTTTQTIGPVTGNPIFLRIRRD